MLRQPQQEDLPVIVRRTARGSSGHAWEVSDKLESNDFTLDFYFIYDAVSGLYPYELVFKIPQSPKVCSRRQCMDCVMIPRLLKHLILVITGPEMLSTS